MRAARLLELAAVLGGNDGHAYAQYVIQILDVLDDADNTPVGNEVRKGQTKGKATSKVEQAPVLEYAVEVVLLRVRNGKSS
jgi:hypothetical protein